MYVVREFLSPASSVEGGLALNIFPLNAMYIGEHKFGRGGRMRKISGPYPAAGHFDQSHGTGVVRTISAVSKSMAKNVQLFCLKDGRA